VILEQLGIADGAPQGFGVISTITGHKRRKKPTKDRAVSPQ
jgi:hypothetical protein